jgi:tetratricopeptide (TPR) repeat protein
MRALRVAAIAFSLVAGLAAARAASAAKLTDAEAAFAANRDADAIALYGEAIAETAADPATQAAAYFGRGEVEAADGHHDPAIADFTAALALKQDDAARANTFFSRGESYLRKRNFQAAADDYAEAIRLAPTMPEVHLARARVLRAMKRNAEAVAEYDAELKIDPKSQRAASARADLLGLPQPKQDDRDHR